MQRMVPHWAPTLRTSSWGLNSSSSFSKPFSIPRLTASLLTSSFPSRGEGRETVTFFFGFFSFYLTETQVKYIFAITNGPWVNGAEQICTVQLVKPNKAPEGTGQPKPGRNNHFTPAPKPCPTWWRRLRWQSWLDYITQAKSRDFYAAGDIRVCTCSRGLSWKSSRWENPWRRAPSISKAVFGVKSCH